MSSDRLLSLIGLPHESAGDISPNVAQAISSADIVASFFSIHWHENYLTGAARSVYDLRPFYPSSDRRAHGYRATADAVQALFQSHSSVAYCCYGSPIFLDDIARHLMAWAAANDVRLNIPVVPSFLDHMLSGLCIPVTTLGLQLIEATRLVRCPQLLNPRLPLLLAQVGIVGIGSGDYRTANTAAIQELGSILVTGFGMEARAFVVDFDQASSESIAAEFALNEFTSHCAHFSPAASLYIPAG